VKRIFGLMRDEVTGGWRKLLNGELHALSRECSTNYAYTFFCGNLGRKAPPGKLRRR
jgi:hypothetical protein